MVAVGDEFPTTMQAEAVAPLRGTVERTTFAAGLSEAFSGHPWLSGSSAAIP